MNGERAADEADATSAGAESLQSLDSGVDHSLLVGKAEIVVRRENENVAAPLHLHTCCLRRIEVVQCLVDPIVAQLLELRFEICRECGIECHRSLLADLEN